MRKTSPRLRWGVAFVALGALIIACWPRGAEPESLAFLSSFDVRSDMRYRDLDGGLVRRTTYRLDPMQALYLRQLLDEDAQVGKLRSLPVGLRIVKSLPETRRYEGIEFAIGTGFEQVPVEVVERRPLHLVERISRWLGLA